MRGLGTRSGPLHLPPPPRPVAEESDDERFIHRPCYVFNPALRTTMNDERCSHCRYYLTARCPHIDEFLDDVEDLSPD